ncbi:MAG: DUF1292 domain-containing protein [Clostridia bacterium]|nr:DUF1292 domain-containing protein [Clostridia bacterium]
MNDNPKNIPEEEEDDLIELVDEEGNTTVFEHLATLEHKGETYLAVSDPEQEGDELEVFILKIETDDKGEDIYTVPDDDVADEVYEAFLKLVEDTADDDAE